MKICFTCLHVKEKRDIFSCSKLEEVILKEKIKRGFFIKPYPKIEIRVSPDGICDYYEYRFEGEVL